MLPVLPQDDPNPQNRAASLVAEQKKYSYSYQIYDSLAISADIPKGEESPQAGLRWLAMR
jgi:hypothetical protein